MKTRSLALLISLPFITACGEPADAIQELGQAEIIGQTYGHDFDREDVRCLFNTIEFKKDGTVITTSENRADLNYVFHYAIKPHKREDIKLQVKLFKDGLLKFSDWTCAKLS